MNIFNIFKKNISTESPALDLYFQNKVKKGFVWNQGKSLEFYLSSYLAFRAIEKRAQKVGQVNLFLKKGDEIIRKHELLNLLAKPNDLLTGEQFFSLWSKYIDIYGKAFILILKEGFSNRKISLELLDPRKCKANFNKLGEFIGIDYNGKTNAYSSQDIIYDYNPDPDNPKEGISLLRAGANLLQTQIDLDAINAQLIKSGGKIDGIINFKSEQIGAEQMIEFREKYKEQLENKEDFGNLVFLGGDASYQKTSLSPEELGYLNTRKAILNDICILTDVPQALMGALENIKYDNAQASINIFLRETITPLIRQKIHKLNEKVQLIPEELELSFDDPAPEDIERKLKINDSAFKGKYLTINEMRANVGYNEIEGGDELPKTSNPFAMLEEENEDKETKQKDFNHPLKDYSFRRKYFEKRISEQDAYEAQFLKVFRSYLKDQKDRLIEAMGGKRKDILDSSFNMKVEISLAKGQLMPLLMKMMVKSGNDAMRLAGSNKPFNWGDAINSSLDQRAELFSKSINDTTFKLLKKEFTRSQDLGEGRKELIKRIEEVYSDYSKTRATMIARTEVHAAVQSSTLEGYYQAGMTIKIWVAVMDEVTRDEHAEMDGEERPINMPFSNGEQFPSSINCRCQI